MLPHYGWICRGGGLGQAHLPFFLPAKDRGREEGRKEGSFFSFLSFFSKKKLHRVETEQEQSIVRRPETFFLIPQE